MRGAILLAAADQRRREHQLTGREVQEAAGGPEVSPPHTRRSNLLHVSGFTWNAGQWLEYKYDHYYH